MWEAIDNMSGLDFGLVCWLIALTGYALLDWHRARQNIKKGK